MPFLFLFLLSLAYGNVDGVYQVTTNPRNDSCLNRGSQIFVDFNEAQMRILFPNGFSVDYNGINQGSVAVEKDGHDGELSVTFKKNVLTKKETFSFWRADLDTKETWIFSKKGKLTHVRSGNGFLRVCTYRSSSP